MLRKWDHLIEADEQLRDAERAWKESDSDEDALVNYVNQLIRARKTVSRSLWKPYEEALLKRERYLDKRNRDNATKILAVIARRMTADVEAPDIPAGVDDTAYQILLDWIDAGWPGHRRAHAQGYSSAFDNIAQKIEKHMCMGIWKGGDPAKHKSRDPTGTGYTSSISVRAFDGLVYEAARDLIHYNQAGETIRHTYNKNLRRAVAETLLWRCEASMAAGEFDYQQFANRPLLSNLSPYQIQELLAKQHELGRKLSKRDIGKVLNPHRYKDPDDFSEPKPKKKRRKKKK